MFYLFLVLVVLPLLHKELCSTEPPVYPCLFVISGKSSMSSFLCQFRWKFWCRWEDEEKVQKQVNVRGNFPMQPMGLLYLCCIKTGGSEEEEAWLSWGRILTLVLSKFGLNSWLKPSTRLKRLLNTFRAFRIRCKASLLFQVWIETIPVQRKRKENRHQTHNFRLSGIHPSLLATVVGPREGQTPRPGQQVSPLCSWSREASILTGYEAECLQSQNHCQLWPLPNGGRWCEWTKLTQTGMMRVLVTVEFLFPIIPTLPKLRLFRFWIF